MILQKLKFEITINAPKEKVWKVLLEDRTYRQWTSIFMEGSHFKGDWNEGSKILFVSPEGDGMISRIAKHIPNEVVTIEHQGVIQKNVEDYTGKEALEWKGGHETYIVSEERGKTLLQVETDTTDEYAGYFNKTWPVALEKVKELAEE